MNEIDPVDIIALISADIPLEYAAHTDGGEWAGSCPRCGGKDRFRVWAGGNGKRPRFWCRQCQIKGDAVDYVRLQHPNLSFREARRIVSGNAPTPAQRARRVQWRQEQTTPAVFTDEYQQRAREFRSSCQSALWSDVGARALDWLRGRGFRDETIDMQTLGFNPADKWEPATLWGIDRDKPVFLPRGVVIPWWDGEIIRRVNIRRAKGDPKYLPVAGFSNWMYGALHRIEHSRVVLVEGEFDAISLAQVLGDLVAPLATGSVAGGRAPELIERLTAADKVLVAFDADEPGDQAAGWWLRTLPNAERLRPTRHDVNQMLQDGDDLRAWVGVKDVLPEQLALLDVGNQAAGWWQYA